MLFLIRSSIIRLAFCGNICCIPSFVLVSIVCLTHKVCICCNLLSRIFHTGKPKKGIKCNEGYGQASDGLPASPYAFLQHTSLGEFISRKVMPSLKIRLAGIAIVGATLRIAALKQHTNL